MRSAAPPVYLDHAATTPVRPEVRAAMEPFFGPAYGNPSSAHRWGRAARTALDEARERVAACVGAGAGEIVFTSGGTEADHLALLGAWHGRADVSRRVVVSTPVEHKAVLRAVEHLGGRGAEVRWLAVDGAGVVCDPDSGLRDDVAVCSVMWANNETGVVQPVAAVADRARNVGAVFHTDAVQAFGKLEVDVRRAPVDLLSISGHKLGAPKGVGALYVRRGTPFAPTVVGTQERGLRPGTENVAFAVALAAAAELAIAERRAEAERLTRLRDALEAEILRAIPDAVVHGRTADRAPHVLSVSAPGADGADVLLALDLHGVAASNGSACQAGVAEPSHVLLAMGVEPVLAAGAVRFSLGASTTPACVERVGEVFPRLVAKVRQTATAG